LKSTRLIVNKYGLITILVAGLHLTVLLWVGLVQRLSKGAPLADVMTLSLRDPSPVQIASRTLRKTQNADSSKRDLVAPIALGSGINEATASLSATPTLHDRSVYFNPRPPYPMLSRRMGEQGAVDLKLCINKRGLVDAIHLAKSSGYQKLDQSAMETVKTWRFAALDTGTETSFNCYHLPIHFILQA